MSSKMNVLHLSNLNLHYLAPAEPPKADEGQVIILNGNIADHGKRFLLFVEDVANANPTCPVIFNISPLELNNGSFIRDSYTKLAFRYTVAKVGPPNLFYPSEPTEIAGHTFMCVTGLPKLSVEEFLQAKFRENISSEKYTNFYIGDRLITERFPQKITYEEYTEFSEQEAERIQKFQAAAIPNKVLISALPFWDTQWFNWPFVHPAEGFSGRVIYSSSTALMSVHQV